MKASLLILIILILAACSSDSDSDSTNASINMIPVISESSTDRVMERSAANNDTGDIENLEYYITSINLYQDMTINGTGYSGTSGPFNLYQAANAPDYDTFDDVQARATTNGYINIVDSNSLAALASTKQINSTHVGDYYYAAVDWLQPMKLKASLTIGSNTIYSKDGTLSRDNDTSPWVTTAADLTTGPAELAIARLNNGGTWFKLLNPFTVTADDVTNGVVFNILIVFNPEDYLFGWYNETVTNSARIIDGSNNGFYIPFLNITPVVYRQGESVECEIYTFEVNIPPHTYDVRLELYYITSDPGTICAVDLRHLINSAGDLMTNSAQKIFSIEENGNQLNFLNWLNTAVISNFTRLTSVGTSADLTYEYDNSSSSAVFSYTLDEIRQIQ